MYQPKNPPLSPKESLPTMYDLPSEEIGDSGLPDQYHVWQGCLFEETFFPPNYPPEQVFSATDLNLYYDLRHPKWYKRPDWFGVVGVDQFYQKRDPRLSYVIWQEEVSPFILVELLSPSTEKEDLGQTLRSTNQPPGKWDVYEKILRIPYYVVFNGSNNQLRLFQLKGNRYQEVSLSENKFWLPEIELGLGLWAGKYRNLNRLWLRWYDQDGNWIPTVAEQEKQRAEQEKQRAEQEKQRANNVELENQRLRELLTQAGIEIPESM